MAAPLEVASSVIHRFEVTVQANAASEGVVQLELGFTHERPLEHVPAQVDEDIPVLDSMAVRTLASHGSTRLCILVDSNPVGWRAPG